MQTRIQQRTPLYWRQPMVVLLIVCQIVGLAGTWIHHATVLHHGSHHAHDTAAALPTGSDHLCLDSDIAPVGAGEPECCHQPHVALPVRAIGPQTTPGAFHTPVHAVMAGVDSARANTPGSRLPVPPERRPRQTDRAALADGRAPPHSIPV